MKKIGECRREIDKIDDKILELLNERMNFVKEIGVLKHSEKQPIYRPEREKEILERLKRQSSGFVKDGAVEAIYSEIFAVSRNIEFPEKIAFLGPEGTYSHQAARSRFGAQGSYLALNSIEAVFQVLANKEAKYGVVPIENNTEGAVGITLDCLGKFQEIKIVAELYMDIHHSFATFAEDVKDIKRIYSHPQGYNQCRQFLETHMLSGAEFIPAKSTAEAARMASLEEGTAAICSHIAAKLYNVPILFEKIEDNLANRTRFVILSDFKNAKGAKNKTSILAKTQDKPGGLLSLLEIFKNANINLTKLESRPTKGRDFKRVFYLDFEGHIDDENIQNMLNGNGKIYDIIWLGSYIFEG
ncbi:MAG: prephenate dehydratase [Campylobacteraceae bacterium]|jgi:chorismate mutase/prephenate dehydratase|nr:prephenate dehydratase [Campylobacteraceae bacterium]